MWPVTGHFYLALTVFSSFFFVLSAQSEKIPKAQSR